METFVHYYTILLHSLTSFSLNYHSYISYATLFAMRLHLQLAGLLLLAWTCAPVKYTEDWKSLDSRPLPGWYDEAKVGIFIHWGVFSVPAYASEWIWWYWRGSKNKMVVDFMAKNYRPDFTYADFAPMFTAEFYDADKWAGVLQKSGAQLVRYISKYTYYICICVYIYYNIKI